MRKGVLVSYRVKKKKIITLKNDIEDINLERKPSIFKILEVKFKSKSFKKI